MAELFEDFEINRAPRTRRLTRTVALSLVAHAAFIAVVIYAPTARALWQLSSMLTGAEYADADYTLGEVRESAVMIGPAEKLHYPPGYFNHGNAEVVEEPSPTPTPTPKPRPTPRPTPTPEEKTEVATNEEKTGEDGLSEEQKREKEQTDALDKLAEQGGVKLPPKINTRPFKDLLNKWAEEYEKGNLNLDGNISVTVTADRREDGTLENMQMTGGSASDPALKEIAKDAVRAISATHALQFLEGARHLKMTLTLDQRRIHVVVSTEMDTAERASTAARVYGVGIGLVSMKKRGTDEGEVWKNVTTSSNGRNVVVTFNMPRDKAGDLLAKQVNEGKGN